MVKHIVLWNFVETLSEAEKKEAVDRMKALLEPIRDKVPGAVEIQVIGNELSSSNRDVSLISAFDTVEALAAYQTHPEHVEAGKYIKSITCNRSCMDYEF